MTADRRGIFYHPHRSPICCRTNHWHELEKPQTSQRSRWRCSTIWPSARGHNADRKLRPPCMRWLQSAVPTRAVYLKWWSRRSQLCRRDGWDLWLRCSVTQSNFITFAFRRGEKSEFSFRKTLGCPTFSRKSNHAFPMASINT